MKNEVKKTIIFFDGDGTVWYPRKTKYKEKPHWVYSLEGDHCEHNKHLEMVPTALNTLKKLKNLGVITVLLSSNPKPPKEANEIIQQRVRHFELENLFDEVYATRAHHASKGKFIVKILKKKKDC
jgi:magnesium-dependent phosphatase-1